MKRFADAFYNGKWSHTNCYAVKNLKYNDPVRYENTEFYSTHRKKERKRKMHLVEGKNSLFFRYNSKENSSNSGSSVPEFLTHELIKEVIADLDVLNFRIGNNDVRLYVIESEIEYTISHPEGSYILDLFVRFNKSEPEIFFAKWNGIVGIEIRVTNETSFKKKYHLKDLNIPVIEVGISDKFRINDEINLSEDSIEEKRDFFTKRLSEVIFGKVIIDSVSFSFLNDQIIKLKDNNKKLRSERENDISKIYKLKNEVSKLKDEISNIVMKNKELQNLNDEISESLIEHENKLKKIQNNIIYRLLLSKIYE